MRQDGRRLPEANVDGPIYDIVVAGSGPAGLTAALFGARAGLDVMVLGSETGLLSGTKNLENFPGLPNTNGPALLKATKEQALSFGAKFATPGTLATEILLPTSTTSGDIFTIPTTSSLIGEQQIHGRSIIVATGATPRQLNLPNEDLLWGKSLHSCAICDGHLYLDKTVMVVGGGDSALDAANLLARYAKKVYIVHRRSTFSGNNQVAIDVAKSTPNIEMVQPFVVKNWQLDGNSQLIGAHLQSTESNDGGNDKTLTIDGAFVMIGATPNTAWLQGYIDLEQDGLVKLTGATASSYPGLFAAGEVSDNMYKQAVTASAEGAQAAIDAERWLRQVHGVHRHATIPEPITNVLPAAQTPEQDSRNAAEVEDDSCDLTDADCINQTVKKYPVVVFSKSWCPYCRKALEALSAAGVAEPHIVDLSANENAAHIQRTLASLTGRRTVPNVFVGGKSVGGGDETAALQRNGKLVPLLVDAGALDAHRITLSTGDGEQESCNLLKQECVEEIIKKYPVVMFSLEWCPECKRTLELLDSIGAQRPHIIDLDHYKYISQDIRFHLLNISGRKSVPNLFIGGEYFGGFRQTKQMHEEGKLVQKLQQLNWPMRQT